MKKFVFGIILLFAVNTMALSTGKRVYVKKAPPKHKKVVVVKTKKPYRNAIYVKGHWRWNGKKYVWRNARWIKPRRGFVWIPGHWKKNTQGWFYVEGHWKKVK